MLRNGNVKNKDRIDKKNFIFPLSSKIILNINLNKDNNEWF